jgi:hypothetical protein
MSGGATLRHPAAPPSSSAANNNFRQDFAIDRRQHEMNPSNRPIEISGDEVYAPATAKPRAKNRRPC